MKLISMTEFVLKAYDEISDSIDSESAMYNYANFINQPLTLGMFIACDEDGKIMLLPGSAPIYTHSLEYIDKYQQAKNKVLFDGFEYAETHSIGMGKGLDLFVFPYTETKIGLTKKAEGFRTWFKLEKIEDLVQCGLRLTPNAIKKLKL